MPTVTHSGSCQFMTMLPDIKPTERLQLARRDSICHHKTREAVHSSLKSRIFTIHKMDNKLYMRKWGKKAINGKKV